GKRLVVEGSISYRSQAASSAGEATSITVDSQGNAYVTGYSLSSRYPLAMNGAETEADLEIFILKLNQRGDGLEYVSYIGGRATQQSNAIAVDETGNAYIVGTTESKNFPIVG